MTRYLLVGDLMVDPQLARPNWLPTEPVIGNLEIPFCSESTGRRADKVVAWRTDENAVHALRALGVTAVGLANNHGTDWGVSGLLRTRAVLQDAGIGSFGAGADLDEATKPWVSPAGDLAVFGLTCTVPPGSQAEPDRPGMMACRVATRYAVDTTRLEELPASAPVIDGAYREGALQGLLDAIGRANSAGRAVAVHVHWGVAWDLRIAPYQRRIAEALVRAGAGVVVGHHSHTLGPVGAFDGHPVCFGLSDWVRSPRLVELGERQRPGLASDWRNWSRLGLGLSVEVEGARIIHSSLTAVEIGLDDGLPVPVGSTATLEHLAAFLVWLGRLDLTAKGWTVPLSAPVSGQTSISLAERNPTADAQFLVGYP